MSSARVQEWWTASGRAGRAVLDLLFPPACFSCGSPEVESGEVLCRGCLVRLEDLCCTAYCPTCARTVPPFAVSNGRCRECRDRPLKVLGTVRVGPYEPPLRDLLHAFKYRRDWALAGVLARHMAERLRERPWFGAVDALVIVPGWWLRRVRAGYYAPGVLAPHLSRSTNIPAAPCLRRVQGGPTQVGLSAAERVRNVRGRFGLARGVSVRGATLCLVDDVMTTGATLNECGRILLRAGARAVYAAVVAQASQDTPVVPHSARE